MLGKRSGAIGARVAFREFRDGRGNITDRQAGNNAAAVYDEAFSGFLATRRMTRRL